MGIIEPSDIGNDPSLLDALFSSVRKKVLGLLFGNPERSFYFNEIAASVDSGIGGVQRELARLEKSGLVRVFYVGNQKHYQAEPNAPIYNELRSLIVKTIGLVEPLRQALESRRSEIQLALIYGSFAKANQNAASDIDLLIVSDDLLLEDLYQVLSTPEKEVGRKIDPTLYTRSEFDDRLRMKNPFLLKVLNGRTEVLIGTLPDAY